MTTIDDEMIFSTKLPDGSQETFTFQEYLDYRKWLGLPPPDRQGRGEIIRWLNSSPLSCSTVYFAIAVYKRYR